MRIVSGPVGRERVHYEALPHERVAAEMRAFLDWFNKPPAGLDGLLRAGIAHAWFEVVHPFADGNGRVGRALLDMALAQDEQRSTRLYSLSARSMDVRDEYYAALEQTSSGPLDITPWLAWFLTQMAAAVRSSESIVEAVLIRTRFWMQHSRAGVSERQLKALSRMLDTLPQEFVCAAPSSTIV